MRYKGILIPQDQITKYMVQARTYKLSLRVRFVHNPLSSYPTDRTELFILKTGLIKTTKFLHYMNFYTYMNDNN